MPGKKRSSTATHKSQATRKRNDLTKQLRADLKSSKDALRTAGAAAREELKLVRAAAKTEVAVLKDELAALRKREQALVKIAEQKAKLMWKAGEAWEKKQMARIRQAFK